MDWTVCGTTISITPRMVAATGHNEAYYTDYRGKPQELISAVKYGYLYQGQRYTWQKQAARHARLGNRIPRSSSPTSRITIRSRIRGAASVCTSSPAPGGYRAMTALLLLAPGTPHAVSGAGIRGFQPVLLFRRSRARIAPAWCADGRIQFLAPVPQPGAARDAVDLARPRRPGDLRALQAGFQRAREPRAVYHLHKDLLRLRREDPVFRAPQPRGVDGAVLGREAFVLRFFEVPAHERRRSAAARESGRDLHLEPAPEPLLAPPEGMRVDSCCGRSEDPRYGGGGTAPLDDDGAWRIPGERCGGDDPMPET